MRLYKCILYLFVSLICVDSFAYSINSKLELSDKTVKSWTEGETYKVKLTLWPINEIDNEYLRESLSDKKFLDFFFVSKVHSLKFSDNNPEAYEILFDLTLVKHFNVRRPLIWTYKALNIPIQIEGLRILSDKDKISEFVFIKTPAKEETSNYILYIVIVVVIALLVTFIFKKHMKSKNGKGDGRNWLEITVAASTREEFEEIYKNKEIWSKSLSEDNIDGTDLLKVINEHQYKKKWNDNELNSIQIVHSNLREKIKNVG